MISRRYIELFAAAALVFAAWKTGNHFFWRDEWHFLYVFSGPEISWFFKPYVGHIKPLFKFIWFLEANLFGTNAIFYHYFSLAAFALLGWIFLRFSLDIGMPWAVSAAAAALLLLHPINFVTILWTFQSSIILQLVFQMLFVWCLFRFLALQQSKMFWTAFACAVVQTYFFGNGIFIPMLGVVFALLFLRTGKRLRAVLLFGSLQTAVLVIQYFGMQNAPGIEPAGIFANAGKAALFFIDYVGTNAGRYLFIYTGAGSKAAGWILIITVLFLSVYNFREYGRQVILFAAWFFLASLPVPLARFDMPVVHYYYSTLSIIPFFLMILVTFQHIAGGAFQNKWVRGASLAALITASTAWFVIDQRSISIFSQRDYLNEHRMKTAAREESDYLPFDDPVISMDLLRDINNEPSGRTALKAYLYWKGRTPFTLMKEYTNSNNDQ